MKSMIVSCLVSSLAIPVFADVTLDYDGDLVQVKDQKLRMNEPDGRGYMLFDASQNRVTHVDPQQSTFSHLDQKSMAGMGDMMAGLQDQMREAMAELSPEEQAMMADMMGGMMPGQATSEPKHIQETPEIKEINGWKCQVVNVVQNGEILQQMCITKYKSLGLSQQDHATMRSFFRFMESMTEQLGGDAGISLSGLDDESLPIRVKMLKPGVGEDSELRSVSADSLPADLFNIPAGYKEVDQMQMMQEMSQ